MTIKNENILLMGIEIVAYDPAWPKRFAKLGNELRHTLGATALRIDHIGSTAVEPRRQQRWLTGFSPADVLGDRLRRVPARAALRRNS